ncbi:hypothetical protein Pint_29663 [Pistacia integerrima]|uniref:Uncharacterized protein n=1 Tax=Pistacia integerrima TaxID=434235 RepID=A0ACC0WZF4_9ROSI|nr:hypothetical protein Pint_29663 [Pistacia integerrima]
MQGVTHRTNWEVASDLRIGLGKQEQDLYGLEYVTGGELFDRINVLVDSKGNIKTSDFGLSALPQHFRDDGLLHTTCGSPNYVAPEVLANRGYDGATSDIWSCSVILYIFKGDAKIPKWLSPGAQNMLRRILEPNPIKRMTMADIKADEWFKHDYTPADPNDEYEDIFIDDEVFLIQEAKFHIFKGDAKIPKWLSPGAQNMLRRILEPNPIKQMTMADIKANEWFKQDYTPADPNDEDEDIFIDDEAFSMQEAV